ncbi:MAG: hypothetical protein LWW85_03575 [Marinilabiliales bacterium]|nr:hypothetical protein [Marinilabiliales bacterium]
MKRFIFCFGVLWMLHLSLQAQDTLTVYYDKDWKVISDRSIASFYRKASKNHDKTWTVNDYFISGKLQMSGQFKSKKFDDKFGRFVYYFENGQKKSAGEFVKNKEEGEWKSWHENGQLLGQGMMTKGHENGEWNFWYDTGEKSSNGQYVNGLKEGDWSVYYKNGKLKEVSRFTKGHMETCNGYSEIGQKDFTGVAKPKTDLEVWSYWNTDGKMFYQGCYKGKYKVGRWVRYTENGDSLIYLYDNNGKLLNSIPGRIAKN